MFKVVLVLFLFTQNTVFAQENEQLKSLIKAQLNADERKSLDKAEKFYAGAADNMKLADKNEGADQKKTLKYRITGSKNYGKANKITYGVYKRDLKRFFNNIDPVKAKKAEQKMEQAEVLMKEAKKKREASLRVNVLTNVYALLEKANKYESRAVKNMEDVYAMFIGDSQAVGGEIIVASNVNNNTEEQEVKTSENVTNTNNDADIVNTDNNVNEETKTEKPNEEIIKSEPVKIQGSTGVFFLLQVAASQSPMSEEGLSKRYNQDITGEKFGEWYKYFVNKKFASLQEADNFKTKMSARGIFVVAFKNGQKVGIQEALKKDEVVTKNVVEKKVENNTSDAPVTSKTVYRLEIGISTKPLSATEVRSFKNGGKPVMSVDRGGWFSYTIGDFNTASEALSFKRIKGLTEAEVLKFVNGKVVDE